MGLSALGRKSVLLMIVKQRRLLLFPFLLFTYLIESLAYISIVTFVYYLSSVFPRSFLRTSMQKREKRERHQCNHHFYGLVTLSSLLCLFAFFLLHCVPTHCYQTFIFSGVLVSLHLVHRRMTYVRIYTSDSE